MPANGTKTEVSGLARRVRFTHRSRHRQPAPACPFGANAQQRTLAPQKSAPFDHLVGARERRCRHFEGPRTYVASIRRRVQPLRRMLAQLREFAILRAEETRCYELRGARPAAW